MVDTAIINGAGLLDETRWNGFQKGVLALCALAVMLDGFDMLLLGFTIPSLMKEWDLARGDFIPIVALTIVGMSLGTVLIGYAGDRLGRRPMLIASVAIFGVATLCGAGATGITDFTIFRVLAAIGLGGTFPNTTALIAEFTPIRHRSTAITLAILCVPLGGLFGGLVAAEIIPHHGWRMLFVTGGVLPLLVAALMLTILPESPSFLRRRGAAQRDKLLRLLRRCGVNEVTLPDTGITVSVSFEAGFRQLLAMPLRRETLVLWAVLFCNLFAVYAVFNWGPTLLAEDGFTTAQASLALSAFNFGGVLGALAGGRLMDRMGPRGPTLAFAVTGALLAFGLGTIGWPSGPIMLYIGIGVFGIFCCGLQPMLFALAVTVYPDDIRASGVGAAIGVGRLGAIGSAMVGAGMFAIGITEFLMILAGALLLGAIALLLLRHHSAGHA